jgi:hypothetical protein
MPFSARGRTVQKDSVETKHDEGSSSFTLSFDICEISEFCEEGVAEHIAALLTENEDGQ